MCVLCTLKCEGRVGAKKTGRRIMVRKLISVEHVAGDRRGRESERERERERERVVLFCLSVDKLGTVMREREKKKRRPGFVEKWGWVIK